MSVVAIKKSRSHFDLDVEKWEHAYRHDLRHLYKEFFEKNRYIQCKYRDFVIYCYNHSTRSRPKIALGQPIKVSDNAGTNHEDYGKSDVKMPQTDYFFDFFYEFYEEVRQCIYDAILIILDQDKFTDFYEFCWKFADHSTIEIEIQQKLEKENKISIRHHHETQSDALDYEDSDDENDEGDE